MDKLKTFSKSELRKHFNSIRNKKHKELLNNTTECERTYNSIKSRLEELIKDLSTNTFKKETIYISSYYPIKSEIDILTILEELNINNKFSILLPKVIGPSSALKFYQFNKSELVEGAFGVKEPKADSDCEYMPDIVLTPLLAFDNQRHRLGYGKGYYDRTFYYFKELGNKYISIGIGYDEQFVEAGLPSESNDVSLDYIITPSMKLC
jgi:5,10-methenyltetrahydrofolate synthetase